MSNEIKADIVQVKRKPTLMRLKIILPIMILLSMGIVGSIFIFFHTPSAEKEIDFSKILIFNDGSRYAGEIKNEEANGNGLLVFKNGDSYEGHFKDNLFEGEGVYTFSNGDKYTGQFKKGKFHGKGKYLHADGTIEEGNWINDIFIQ